MKSPVLETRKEAMREIIRSYPDGRKGAAARLDMKVKKFDNHAYESAGCSPLSDAQVYMLEQSSGTNHFPNYVAQMYGGLFVPVADPETLDNVELYARSVQVSAKRGCVDQAIAQALEDGSINSEEAEIILNAHNLHMAARHAEVLAAIDLYRAKPGNGQ
ncbi:YmfL family putative regulatory protein [Pseudomonas sp. 681]|uniref:YmfL family putative regulatory protein n=1 Tax=Pseudomonas fungipugnans TaxID=3024217 RepID=A0ABT6QTT5_9PSED|nr:YmfL family putative regulatory protein [Pseudomonas sp. 681]MDI2594323.1 YmfL family putative regulatory protein [Pseudomonas sp. 681]